MDLKTLPVTRRPTMEANNKLPKIQESFGSRPNGRETSTSICCDDIMKAPSGTEPGINIIGVQGSSERAKDVAETVNMDHPRIPVVLSGGATRSNGSELSTSSCCDDIMKALSGTEPGINIIGLQGPSDGVKDVADTVIRRCTRDNMFDKIVTATVTDKPNPEKIQADIGVLLGVEFDPVVAWWGIWNRKGKKRADRLFDKIKEHPTILVVLFDVNKGIDLAQIGIPFASNHPGCKILLTSTDEKVFSQQMNIDKVVKWRRV